MSRNRSVHLRWHGPYSLEPGSESLFVARAAREPGVYLFTSRYHHGYLIYFAGITQRPLAQRIKEHIREYRKGTYNILDARRLAAGQRRVIWRGMWTRKETNTPEVRMLFQSRQERLQPQITSLLSAFRIFLAPLHDEERVLARVESAIMDCLYSAPTPMCSIPDRGMALAVRHADEPPFTVLNTRPPMLFGLPATFEA
jgi:hypothetical protein